jgi:phage terminase large subunit-like protein
MELLPWQRWLLIHALETLDDGTFRFRTVVLLVARQNGKSTLMQVLALWRMYVDGAPLTIGTAQNLDIAEEVWQGAVDMAQEVPDLAAEIEKVDLTNGKKALRLLSGSRYKVQAATRRGGRGLSGDLVILDELREHQNWEAWSAVTKTTMAREKAQIWAASNAGDSSSVVLSHLRLLAHLALGDPDKLSPEDARLDVEDVDDESLGIFEWSAPAGIDVHDREGWAQANPSLGHTITERAIGSALATDPEPVFRTEVLCQWVDSMREGAFPPGVWEANAISDVLHVTRSPVVAVDLRTGMQQSLAIVVAGGTDKGFDLIEVARYELGADTQWAEDFAVAEVKKILESLRLDTVVIDKVGDNQVLVTAFEDANIRVTQLSLMDFRNGCVSITDALINGRLKHRSEEPLNIAVLGAGKRPSGEQFVWSQGKSSTDITPLRAATAAWWVYQSGPADYDVLDSFY